MREGGSFLSRDIGEPFDDFDRARHAEIEKALFGASRRPRKARKPKLSRLLAEADRAGKPVSSAVIDGVELRFGEPSSAPTNDLDKWMAKHNAN